MSAPVAVTADPVSGPARQTGAVPRRRIAFVCLGNSCRSQMAEGWTRHLAAGRMEVVSAGVSPLGHITEETFAVMKEKGVSLDGQTSKGLEEIDWQQVDLLVNMTPLPSRSLVPGFRGNRLNWRVPDPFGRSLKDYRRVRDLLERKVTRLLAQLATQPGGTPTIDLD